MQEYLLQTSQSYANVNTNNIQLISNLLLRTNHRNSCHRQTKRSRKNLGRNFVAKRAKFYKQEKLNEYGRQSQ